MWYGGTLPAWLVQAERPFTGQWFRRARVSALGKTSGGDVDSLWVGDRVTSRCQAVSYKSPQNRTTTILTFTHLHLEHKIETDTLLPLRYSYLDQPFKQTTDTITGIYADHRPKCA